VDAEPQIGTVNWNTVNLPPLPAGETWDTSQLDRFGYITVIPEPASAAMILAVGSPLLCRRSRLPHSPLNGTP
jgi:hypothetical protein